MKILNFRTTQQRKSEKGIKNKKKKALFYLHFFPLTVIKPKIDRQVIETTSF